MEARKLKETLDHQSSTLKAQFAELTERECRLAHVRHVKCKVLWVT